MTHRICYPMIDIPERCIVTVTTPKGGLFVGETFLVDNIDDTIEGNFTQYVPTLPTDDNLRFDSLGIVISGGNYYTMLDGRKPKGEPDYTKYQYKEGETAPVLLLEPRNNFLSFR